MARKLGQALNISYRAFLQTLVTGLWGQHWGEACKVKGKVVKRHNRSILPSLEAHVISSLPHDSESSDIELPDQLTA